MKMHVDLLPFASWLPHRVDMDDAHMLASLTNCASASGLSREGSRLSRLYRVALNGEFEFDLFLGFVRPV